MHGVRLTPRLLEVLFLGALGKAEPVQAALQAGREQRPFHDAHGLAKQGLIY